MAWIIFGWLAGTCVGGSAIYIANGGDLPFGW